MGPLIVVNLGADKKILKELKAIGGTLLNIVETLTTIQHKQEEHVMSNRSDFDALAAQIDAAATAIGQRIADLTAKIGVGMSDEDVAAVKAEFQTEVDKLTALGAAPTP